MGDDELVEKLMEEHKDDFAPAEKDVTNEGNPDGGDNGNDNAKNEDDGAKDSPKDTDLQPSGSEDEEEKGKPGEGTPEPTEPDDSDDPKIEPVGEKKDANSRIRQLLEEKKELAFKLAEKEEAERKALEAKEDPVYTLDSFIGTLDDNGDPLTDTEAAARFAAWEADYKYRQLEKQTLLKDQQNVLIGLQRQTSEAFVKFPEFDMTSDQYDEKLASIANEMFEAGLVYDKVGRVVGSKINPAELLEKLHDIRAEQKVTKVNNLPADDGKIISSQQVNKNVNKYAPGFRGEVDKELDKLIEKEK